MVNGLGVNSPKSAKNSVFWQISYPIMQQERTIGQLNINNYHFNNIMNLPFNKEQFLEVFGNYEDVGLLIAEAITAFGFAFKKTTTSVLKTS